MSSDDSQNYVEACIRVPIGTREQVFVPPPEYADDAPQTNLDDVLDDLDVASTLTTDAVTEKKLQTSRNLGIKYGGKASARRSAALSKRAEVTEAIKQEYHEAYTEAVQWHTGRIVQLRQVLADPAIDSLTRDRMIAALDLPITNLNELWHHYRQVPENLQRWMEHEGIIDMQNNELGALAKPYTIQEWAADKMPKLHDPNYRSRFYFHVPTTVQLL